MPQVDRSTNILTGMIIAALYVILLVGFVRESYTYRHAAEVDSDRMIWAYMRDVSNMRDLSRDACRVELSLCRPEQASRSRDIWQALREDP